MKGIDFAIRKAAIEKRIPEDQAKVVIMAVWKDIYKRIVGGDDAAISVKHVGTFALSRYKLYIIIRKKIKMIRIIRKQNDPKRVDMLVEEMEKLRKLLNYRNEIAIQYAKTFGNI